MVADLPNKKSNQHVTWTIHPWTTRKPFQGQEPLARPKLKPAARGLVSYGRLDEDEPNNQEVVAGPGESTSNFS